MRCSFFFSELRTQRFALANATLGKWSFALSNCKTHFRGTPEELRCVVALRKPLEWKGPEPRQRGQERASGGEAAGAGRSRYPVRVHDVFWSSWLLACSVSERSHEAGTNGDMREATSARLEGLQEDECNCEAVTEQQRVGTGANRLGSLLRSAPSKGGTSCSGVSTFQRLPKDDGSGFVDEEDDPFDSYVSVCIERGYQKNDHRSPRLSTQITRPAQQRAQRATPAQGITSRTETRTLRLVLWCGCFLLAIGLALSLSTEALLLPLSISTSQHLGTASSENAVPTPASRALPADLPPPPAAFASELSVLQLPPKSPVLQLSPECCKCTKCPASAPSVPSMVRIQNTVSNCE